MVRTDPNLTTVVSVHQWITTPFRVTKTGALDKMLS